MMEVIAKELRNLLAKAPEGRKILAEQEKVDVGARQTIVEEIARLSRELDAKVPPLVKARERAADELRAAQATVLAKERAYYVAEHAEAQARLSLEAHIAALEGQLRATASSLIRELAFTLRSRFADLQADEPSRFARRRFNAIDLKMKLVILTNDRPSRLRQSEAIIAALEALRGLELEALTEEKLRERLEAVQASIPEISSDNLMPRRPEDAEKGPSAA